MSTSSKVLTAAGETWDPAQRRERKRRTTAAPILSNARAELISRSGVGGIVSDRHGRLRIFSRPPNRGGTGGGTGGGSSGSVSSITNAVLSRDVFHAGGGCTITVTGLTGATGSPAITINGVACTSVTTLSSSSLSFVTPAIGGITLPQYVTLVIDGKTFTNYNYLTGGVFGVFGHPTTFNLEVSHDLTTILGQTDFENNAVTSADGQLGADGPLVGGTLAVVGSGVTAPYAGSFCLQQTCPATATGDVAYSGKWAQTDICSSSGGFGRWHRWRIKIPAATLAATANNGQIKQFLSRDGVVNFVVAGIGPAFRDPSQDGINVFAVNNDAGNWNMNSNSASLGSYGVEPTVVADIWHTLMCYEYRDTGASLGYAKFYFDGKKIADSAFQNPTGNAALANMGNNTTTNVRDARFGLVYSELAASYPLTQYLDDVIVCNGAPNS